MTPADTIRELLATFTDARDPLTTGEGEGSSSDGGSPSMTAAWHSGSYRDLETALREMHSLGKQKSIGGVPLGRLWWHVAMRYLMSERKTVWKVGDRTVDSMARQHYCTCRVRFLSKKQALQHIEHIHKPTAELVISLPSTYQKIDSKRRAVCEELAVGWLVGWFAKKKITPRLPRVKA